MRGISLRHYLKSEATIDERGDAVCLLDANIVCLLPDKPLSEYSVKVTSPKCNLSFVSEAIASLLCRRRASGLFKMGLLRWPLVCLLSTLCVLRLGAGMKISDELDSLLCPSIEEKKAKIIDVHKSLELGAELIDGSWESSLESCVSECCRKRGCDMALYKNDGVSQSGKNCYYIKCVSERNCVMVDHSGFTSVVFRLNKNNKGVCVCVCVCVCE